MYDNAQFNDTQLILPSSGVDSLSAERIAEKNRLESEHNADFFRAFIAGITIYEDNAIWVGDKPAGLLSVDGRWLKVSLQRRLLAVYPEIKLIHRLDMDTSGLIIFAKNAQAQRHISKQFMARLPEKEYQALVLGTVMSENGRGVVDVPVRYEPTTKPRHVVDLQWTKQALTHYQVLHHELRRDRMGKSHAVTRLALNPITGRSHQLRVHMLHLGHAMLGDPIYGDSLAKDLANRLALHAHKLRLKHPTDGAWREWVSVVPF